MCSPHLNGGSRVQREALACQLPLVEYLRVRERKPYVLQSDWSEMPPISKI